MAETKKPKEPRYLKEALFLAESYTKMLEEREWLKKRIAGNWTYTKEMAIAELDSITVAYDNERVQSSNISNPTERIAMKLTDEYMARKQAEMDAERDACIADLEYLNWKIGVVDAVIRERLDDELKDMFTLQYKGNRTYRQTKDILAKKRERKVCNDKIKRQKDSILELLVRELILRSNAHADRQFIGRLQQETQTVKEQAEDGE